MTPPPPVAIVLTTFPADQDPAPLARALVDEHLVACVNVHDVMHSIYRWAGKIEEASERQLVIKTTPARVDAVKKRIVELHPYEVPEVLVLPVADGSRAYLQWVHEATASA